MLESHKIYLYDRIKETSYTMGTGNLILNGAANGFSSFGSSYDNNDNIFYAITDGSYYEIGSGVYITGVQNYIIRFPFKSTNSNNVVNFGEGLKEVFVTYPATNSVFTASGIQSNTFPKNSGISFWSSSNIINYDPKFIWNSGESKLGINKSNPLYSIDIGGSSAESIIRSSGIIITSSGLLFPSGNNGDSSYIGGRQLAHYEPNNLNVLTGSDQVLELSGIAKNNILFKKQNAGLVFAGPASGCIPPCSPNYPSFRPLLVEDIHDFNALITDNNNLAIYQKIGINTSRIDGSVTSYNTLFDPTTSGAWTNSSYTASGSYGGAISIVDTASTNITLQNGYTLYTTLSGINLNIGLGKPSGIPSQVLTLDTDNINSISGSVLDFYGQKLRVRNSFTPSTSSSPGNSGDICWDNSYLYICVAPSTWKRASLGSW